MWRDVVEQHWNVHVENVLQFNISARNKQRNSATASTFRIYRNGHCTERFESSSTAQH